MASWGRSTSSFLPLLDTGIEKMSNTVCVVGSVFGKLCACLSRQRPWWHTQNWRHGLSLFQDPQRDSKVKQPLWWRVRHVSLCWFTISFIPFIRMWPLLCYEHGVCHGHHRLRHLLDHLHHHISVLPRHSSQETKGKRPQRWWSMTNS